MTLPESFIVIDEEGFPRFEDIRVSDAKIGSQILSHLKFAENNALVTQYDRYEAVVEAFDEPLVAQMLEAPSAKGAAWQAIFPYDVRFDFELEDFSMDEWDRFHGKTKNGLPFVLSRKAQAELFNIVSEFDDESISFAGHRYGLGPWLSSSNTSEIGQEKYWSDAYRNEDAGWELSQAAPALVEMLPRLKLPKSRILILGCGSGHDAAFFAEQGNFVTAVDFSPEAIAKAQAKFSHIKNLKFVQKNAFDLDASWNNAFDVVFEHTFYCAIPPERRPELVKIWRRVLTPGGSLMGVFFAMEKRQGPPFGGSEWELRERLKKYFQFTFWGRWRQSTAGRNGKELFILANKREL